MSALWITDNANDYRTTALRRVRGKDLTGKVVVVTGGSGALGKQTAFALYQTGATVILAGRTMSKLQSAKEELLTREIPKKEDFGLPVKGGSYELMVLDLADYKSIDNFVKKLQTKYPKIYCLVNNAGVVPSLKGGYKESQYGLETTFQSNFVSTVVLTEKMIPLLQAAASSGDNGSSTPRIVNLSSMSHAEASKPMDFTKIPSTKDTFGGYNKDYCESKWLLTCYTVELSRRLQRTVLVMSADPGASPDSTMWDEVAFPIRFLARYVFKFLTKTGPQAAAVTAHLVVEEASNLKEGGYYQSGVLVPPLRPDTEELDSWKKTSAILKQKLPQDLKWCAEGTNTAK